MAGMRRRVWRLVNRDEGEPLAAQSTENPSRRKREGQEHAPFPEAEAYALLPVPGFRVRAPHALAKGRVIWGSPAGSRRVRLQGKTLQNHRRHSVRSYAVCRLGQISRALRGA